MKYALTFLALFCVLILSGCPYQGAGGPYEVTMYVSLNDLNILGTPPYDVLADYWGKPVYFSVEGIDTDNNSVNVVGKANLSWTGGDQASGTQFAEFTADLSDNTMYLGFRYRFRIFIDWNSDGILSSGDIVMSNYELLADKDGNPDTASLSVDPSEYGTAVVYDASTYSIVINDPLALVDNDGGVTWQITDVHEGTLALY